MAKVIATKYYKVIWTKEDLDHFGIKTEQKERNYASCIIFMKGLFGRRFVKGDIDTEQQKEEVNLYIYNGILPDGCVKY